MNPRRVHELMRKHFPAIEEATRVWVNVADSEGLREVQLRSLLDEFITTALLLVGVQRKVAALLSKADAIQFISEHMSQGTIRVCDRDFHGFVVIATNGVATGWSQR